MSKPHALNVKLTENYRLRSDGLGLVVEERYITQPLAEQLRKEGYVHVPSEAFRDPKYFSLTYAGIAAAIEYVTLITTINESSAETVAELFDFIRVTNSTILGGEITEKLAELREAVGGQRVQSI